MRKLVLITGGTSGLGLAIANTLIHKFDLALGYKTNENNAQLAVSELTGLCSEAKVCAYKVPLKNYESSQILHSAVVKDYPNSSIFAFIHCAGSTSTTLFANSHFEDQLKLIEEHLICGMSLAHLCLPDMYKNKSGRILFMSSSSAHYSYRGHTGYAAAKSGIEAFARTLALEVAHRGITVNCIAPGLIDTPLTHEKIQKMDREQIRNINPSGELPKPKDVASLAHYLLQENAKFITGASIPVDGGQTLGDLKS